MKKIYVLAGALLMASGAFAQGHELFFSAYNEGAHATGSTPPGGGTASQGNERAMQIFNPTNASIPVEKYSVARYSNGGVVPFQEEKMQKNQPSVINNYSLPSSDVFVIGAFKATLLDIVNNWDQKSSDYGPITGSSTVLTQGGPIHFDGNDAMVLRRWTGASAGQGTPIIVDIFGVIGEDPAGGAWFTNTVVGGQTVTIASKNQSLNRKGNIEHGTTVNPTPGTWQIGSEWEVYSEWNGVGDPTGWYAQSYANLAGHAAMYTGLYGAYQPTGILEDFNKAISIYPNPATNKEFKISIENQKVSSITILNSIGQNVKISPINAAQQDIRVDVSGLKPGLYFVKFVSANDYKTTIYKELLVQ